MTKIKYFSHSSLSTYRKCPAQYKFQYLDKIHKNDESIEAYMGKRIHEAIEYLYDEVLAGNIPFFDQIVDKYNSLWKENWHQRIAIVYSQKSPEYYRSLGENCIARYFRMYFPFEKEIVGNEILINFALNNDDNYKFKAIIDRLDHDGDGNWEIHDYKSGKRYYTKRQADNDEQLAIYQLALMSKEDSIKSVKLIWHFLQHGIEIHSERSINELLKLSNKLIRLIKKIRMNIENGSNFEPKKSILCNWCYYWEECPIQNGSNPYIK